MQNLQTTNADAAKEGLQIMFDLIDSTLEGVNVSGRIAKLSDTDMDKLVTMAHVLVLILSHPAFAIRAMRGRDSNIKVPSNVS